MAPIDPIDPNMTEILDTMDHRHASVHMRIGIGDLAHAPILDPALGPVGDQWIARAPVLLLAILARVSALTRDHALDRA